MVTVAARLGLFTALVVRAVLMVVAAVGWGLSGLVVITVAGTVAAVVGVVGARVVGALGPVLRARMGALDCLG